jgi:Flp pilus assembly protein TadG
MRRPRSNSRRTDGALAVKGNARGQSLVEMAIALPVLLLILLGTIDLGRVFFDYIGLRNATTEGATYAARDPTDTSGITTAVTDSGVPSGTTVSVSTTGACTTAGGTGTVTVQADSVFRPLTTAYFAQFGLDTWNLSSSSTMRCLT